MWLRSSECLGCVRRAQLRNDAEWMRGYGQLRTAERKLPSRNGLRQRNVREHVHTDYVVRHQQELRHHRQRVRDRHRHLWLDGRQLSHWTKLRRRGTRLSQRVWMHSRSDEHSLRRQELWCSIRRLRWVDQLRHLSDRTDMWRRESWYGQCLRVHEDGDGGRMLGQVRQRVRRLRRDVHLCDVHRAANVRRCWCNERLWLQAIDRRPGMRRGAKLRHRLRRLRRHDELRIVYRSDHVWRRRNPEHL